jgi:hypothetical protein
LGWSTRGPTGWGPPSTLPLVPPGLEPEIQKLIAKHKQEVRKLRSLHEAELLQRDEQAAQRYLRQAEELREHLEREKEELGQQERARAQQRWASAWGGLGTGRVRWVGLGHLDTLSLKPGNSISKLHCRVLLESQVGPKDLCAMPRTGRRLRSWSSIPASSTVVVSNLHRAVSAALPTRLSAMRASCWEFFLRLGLWLSDVQTFLAGLKASNSWTGGTKIHLLLRTPLFIPSLCPGVGSQPSTAMKVARLCPQTRVQSDPRDMPGDSIHGQQ